MKMSLRLQLTLGLFGAMRVAVWRITLKYELFRMSEIENFNFDEIFDENTVKVKKDFVDVKFILGKKARSLFFIARWET